MIVVHLETSRPSTSVNDGKRATPCVPWSKDLKKVYMPTRGASGSIFESLMLCERSSGFEFSSSAVDACFSLTARGFSDSRRVQNFAMPRAGCSFLRSARSSLGGEMIESEVVDT